MVLGKKESKIKEPIIAALLKHFLQFVAYCMLPWCCIMWDSSNRPLYFVWFCDKGSTVVTPAVWVLQSVIWSCCVNKLKWCLNSYFKLKMFELLRTSKCAQCFLFQRKWFLKVHCIFRLVFVCLWSWVVTFPCTVGNVTGNPCRQRHG